MSTNKSPAKNTAVLPDGYAELCSIDLQKDKKLALLVNLLALAIAAAMVLLGHFIVPLGSIFDVDGPIWLILVKTAAVIAGLVLYVVLHELVHGVCMKHYSGMRADYGFTLMYAYAGSKAYFNRRSYIVIALAPIVFWGAVLLLINIFVPSTWFWVVYIIQVMNVSGAAGDIYVTCRFSRMPADILVQDSGVSMRVYAHSDGKQA